MPKYRINKGGGGGGGGVYIESYTREARFLTRWDQHGKEEEEFTYNRTRARRDS